MMMIIYSQYSLAVSLFCCCTYCTISVVVRTVRTCCLSELYIYTCIVYLSVNSQASCWKEGWSLIAKDDYCDLCLKSGRHLQKTWWRDTTYVCMWGISPSTTVARNGSRSSTYYSDSSYMAYLAVHSLAVASCWVLLFLSIWAISGTNGSSGLGSVSSEQIDSSTCSEQRWMDGLNRVSIIIFDDHLKVTI